MGWLNIVGLLGSLLGHGGKAQPPLQAAQLSGQPALGGGAPAPAPKLAGAAPTGGGFGSMIGQGAQACAGPNPPVWCPKTGTPTGTPPATGSTPDL